MCQPTFGNPEIWKKLIDINGDGKITIEEFDEDAGKSIKEKLQHAVRNKF